MAIYWYSFLLVQEKERVEWTYLDLNKKVRRLPYWKYRKTVPEWGSVYQVAKAIYWYPFLPVQEKWRVDWTYLDLNKKVGRLPYWKYRKTVPEWGSVYQVAKAIYWYPFLPVQEKWRVEWTNLDLNLYESTDNKRYRGEHQASTHLLQRAVIRNRKIIESRSRLNT